MNIAIKVTDDAGDRHILDVYEYSAPKADYQFAELRKPSAALGGYTNTFRIPATKANVDLFGPLHDPAATTDYLTKQKKDAQVEFDTIPVFTGFIRLLRVIVQRGEIAEYEVMLFGDTSSLSKDLGDQSLADLDFSALNHSLTYSNVTTSWSDSLLSGNVVYPLADYGAKIGFGPSSYRKIDTADGALDPDHFKPWVKLKYIVDRIFDVAGWEYDSDFFTSEPFTKLIVPWVNHAGARMEQLPDGADAAWGLLSDTGYTLTGGYTNPGWADESTPFYDPSAVVTSGVYAAAQDGVHYVTVSMSAGADGTGTGIADMDWALYRAGSSIPGTERTGTFGPTWSGAVVHTYAITLSSGDNLEVKVRGVGSIIFVGEASAPGNGCFINVVAPGAYTTADMNTAAPEVKAVDLLTDIISLFNLVLVPLKNERKKLKIEPFDTFTGTGDLVDWTEKLDVSKDYTITPVAELQHSELVLTYLTDEDVLNQAVSGSVRDDGERVYGEKVIRVSGNDFATGTEQVKLKVFAATPCAQLDGSIVVAPLFYDSDGSPIRPKLRLLYWGGLQTIGAEESILTGTADATLAGSLLETGAGFDSAGVQVGDRVDNTTLGGFAFVTGAITANSVALSDDIIASGEDYAITRNGGWYMNHPTGSTYQFSDYPYAGQFETPNSGLTDVDLAFGVDTPFHYVAYQTYNNLFYAYYDEYFNGLYSEEGRVLEAYFKLSPADVLAFKFNDRIQALGCVWRIDALMGYGMGTEDPVKARLIKLLDTDRCRYIPYSTSLDSLVTFEDIETEIAGTNTSTGASKLIDAGAPFSGVTTDYIARNLSTGQTALVTAVDSASQLSLSADIFPSGSTAYTVRLTGSGSEACCVAAGLRWYDGNCYAKKNANPPPQGPGIPAIGGPVPVDGSGTGPDTIAARYGSFPAGRLGGMGGIGSGVFTGLRHGAGGQELETEGYQGIRMSGSNGIALHDGEDIIGGGWFRGEGADAWLGVGQAGRVVLIGKGSAPTTGDKVEINVQGRTNAGEINIPTQSGMFMNIYVQGIIVNGAGTITSAGSLYFQLPAYRVSGGNVTVPASPIHSTLSGGANPIKSLWLDLTQTTAGLLQLSVTTHSGSGTFSDTGYFTALVDYVLIKNLQ